MKDLHGTTVHTKGLRGAVSSSPVVLKNERRLLQSLKEIKNLLSQYARDAPQLLEAFKMKDLLTLIVEKFSEMRGGSYDMPLQLQDPEAGTT